jgi:alpha-glucosidase
MIEQRYRRRPAARLLALALLGSAGLQTATPLYADQATVGRDGLEIPVKQGVVSARLLTDGIVRLRFTPNGGAPVPATVVIDPKAAWPATPDAHWEKHGDLQTLASSQLILQWDARRTLLTLEDAQHRRLLQLDPRSLARGTLQFKYGKDDALYGIHGYNATDSGGGLLRSGKQLAHAGEQGDAGAPFVWSTAGYGVLVDAVGARFRIAPQQIKVRGDAARMGDVYLMAGSPPALFGALAQISGHTPLFPKWAMGFTNSQWGIDEKELRDIVDTYRAKHIPIDNFTLDFDWKAWGEDNFGEFRWNTEKFPDGPSGKLKEEMDKQGIHLTGIMKPRVHVDTIEGQQATARGFWLKESKPAPDYFSHKIVREIDLSTSAAREWFFNDALKHSFATGIVGWWNDEADDTGVDLQHFDMERALYDGQRSISDKRVWSLNRNFYLGAQRYAYGLWSGDIRTGFASMAGQRQRMLSAINVGAMQWGMDGGGFKGGTPTPENYARWIQFGAFTPIFRVHGELGQKRQPWTYGPIAEKAAADAIRLRYTLIPYIYSHEYARRTTGVGLVRPLVFDWPNDPKVRNDVDAWMFGDSLLVSPIVTQGQQLKRIYLPAGQWTDWFTGKQYEGGQTIEHQADAKNWSDIPLFVRDGAIIPMQPVMDYVGEHPVTQLDVEVFPGDKPSHFDYYDDDGKTYDYENGRSFHQPLAVRRQDGVVTFKTGEVQGSFRPVLRYYLLKIHGGKAGAVTSSGHALHAFPTLDALQQAEGEGWATGQDRFGPVTYVRLAAAQAREVALITGS